MRKLFDLIDYNIITENDKRMLIIDIEPNNYTSDHIEVELDDFNAYLERNDLMLTYKNQFDMESDTIKVSIDEYFSIFSEPLIKEDIYNYVCAYHCDYGKSLDTTLANINSILNRFFI